MARTSLLNDYVVSVTIIATINYKQPLFPFNSMAPLQASLESFSTENDLLPCFHPQTAKKLRSLF